MNIVRILILVFAVGAAALTAVLVRSLISEPPTEPVQADAVPQIPTTQILVAARDLEVGSTVVDDDLRWQEWPESALAKAYLTRDASPDAIKDTVGSVVRSEIKAASPITPGRLVKAEDGGFLSVILEGGMRAVSIRISPESGAGGFILPGDRVDVLQAREEEVNTDAGIKNEFVSETVLENVRVLAIDQTISESTDGSDGGQDASTPTVIGKTATLELTPSQAETVARISRQGGLSLSLRSLERAEDAEYAQKEAEADAALEAQRARTKPFSIIRFSVPTVYRPK